MESNLSKKESISRRTEQGYVLMKDMPNKTKDFIAYSSALFIFGTTIISSYFSNSDDHVSISRVWFYGWLTAISTGLGVIPFLFVSEPDKFWMGISNALAGGMMVAASYSLFMEGISIHPDSSFPFELSPFSLTISGGLIGFVFIHATKSILDSQGDFELDDLNNELSKSVKNTTHSPIQETETTLSSSSISTTTKLKSTAPTTTTSSSSPSSTTISSSLSSNRMFLLIFVMTLHSITEGIGIGVSFGGQRGKKLGQFIALSLAVHNIPEGLAVALILTARKVNKLRTALWCIFTSLPQPLMCVPAFLFVESFLPFLPVGLGFAGGAMCFVSLFELFPEALEDVEEGLEIRENINHNNNKKIEKENKKENEEKNEKEEEVKKVVLDMNEKKEGIINSHHHHHYHLSHPLLPHSSTSSSTSSSSSFSSRNKKGEGIFWVSFASLLSCLFMLYIQHTVKLSI